jgi:hypothetical protein
MMNEVIAKLAEEATYEMEFGGDVLQTSNGDVTYEIPAGFIEAFTKLIVRDCIGLIEQPDYGSTHDSVIVDICDGIKEHFGVEE